MNIAWLSFYTNPNNPESSRITNESSAFAIYARWRAMVRLTNRLYAPIYRYFQKRATHRKLMILPDYLLADIGMYRSENMIMVEPVRRAHLVNSAALTSDKNKGPGCVVLPVMPTARQVPGCVSVDDASRAA